MQGCSSSRTFLYPSKVQVKALCAWTPWAEHFWVMRYPRTSSCSPHLCTQIALGPLHRVWAWSCEPTWLLVPLWSVITAGTPSPVSWGGGTELNGHRMQKVLLIGWGRGGFIHRLQQPRSEQTPGLSIPTGPRCSQEGHQHLIRPCSCSKIITWVRPLADNTIHMG